MSAQSFEEQSFRNIIDFYREELLRVESGELASSIFTTRCERVKLLKKNVFRVVPCQSGKKLALTDAVLMILHPE